MSDLSAAFHQAMLDIYQASITIGYRPTRLLQMTTDSGGVETARAVLAQPTPTDGFTTLWEKGRLDLAVESLVLKPAFAALFTDEERQRARDRLREVRYTPPWANEPAAMADDARIAPATAPSFEAERTPAVQPPPHPAEADATKHPFYAPAALAPMLNVFKTRFTSFDTPAYLDAERTYKLMAAARMRELIGQATLSTLIAQQQFDAAKTAIRQACQGSFQVSPGVRQNNNLLNQWDLRPLLDAPAEPLARRLYDLLYGDGPFADRFDAWVALLATKKPGVWPSATYFLMLHDPATSIFVKPTPWQALLQTLGSDRDWPTKPTAAFYERVRGISHQRRGDLAPLGARDMIDVQSFVWSTHYYADQGAWIFQADPRTYDMRGALAALEEISWPVHQHEKDIKIGDTIYLWEADEAGGLLAVAEVLTAPGPAATEISDRLRSMQLVSGDRVNYHHYQHADHHHRSSPPPQIPAQAPDVVHPFVRRTRDREPLLLAMDEQSAAGDGLDMCPTSKATRPTTQTVATVISADSITRQAASKTARIHTHIHHGHCRCDEAFILVSPPQARRSDAFRGTIKP